MAGTETLTLPSGATAQLRTRVTYGASVALTKIGAKIAATKMTNGNGGPPAATAGTVPQGEPTPADLVASGAIDIENLADIMMAQKYFATVYMVLSWTCTDEDGNALPIPTIDDISSLEGVGYADGTYLVAECDKRFEALTTVDFKPTGAEGDTPFGSGSASEPTPAATA